MKVKDLILELMPYKEYDIIIVDNDETLISKDIKVGLTPEKLVENKDNKYISAIVNDGDNVVGKVVYLVTKDFYQEVDYWKHNKSN